MKRANGAAKRSRTTTATRRPPRKQWDAIIVEWEDAFVIEQAQHSTDIAKSTQTCTRRTAGFFISESKWGVKIAGTDDRDAEDKVSDCEHALCVPRGMIRRIIDLVER